MHIVGLRLISLLLLSTSALESINIPFVPSFAPLMSEEHWDWDEIKSVMHDLDIEHLATYFPKIFLWGVGTSDIQMNGHKIHWTLDSQHRS